jgi:glycosyltransferase involved in cell wall biosynthesis
MQNDKSKIRTNLPKISIIIPSFNKGKFIRQTLKSIVDQDYEKVEVIICDGGSSDNSLEIIKEFAKKYYYFSWVSKKDKGQVDAINKGMQKAIGEILTYINADDVYEKNAFEKIVHVFQKNPEALWFAGRGKVINQEGDEIAGCVSWYN